MRYLALAAVLLAACDSTGPEDWTHEGQIESGWHSVTDVDQYADVVCQIDGRSAQVWTGEGASAAHCRKHYHTVTSDGIVYPIHTLYIADGPIGRGYRVRVH